jgi:tetratricopeptide (TPR) repeat protein
MRPSLACLALFALVSGAFPGMASAADDTTVAREHFEKGKAFMDLAKYNEAAAEYEAAYAAKPDPALLLNLAQAYRQAGNADKALHFYRKYLQHVPKSPYRADIEDKIAALEKQIKEGGATTPPPAGGGTSGGSGNTGNPGNPGWSTTPPPPNGSGTGQPPYTPPPPPPPPPLGSGEAVPPAGGTSLGTVPPPPGGNAPAIPVGPGASPDPGKSLKVAGYAVGGFGVVSFVLAAVFGAQAKDAAKKIEDAAARGGTYDMTLQNQDSRGRSAQGREVVSIVVGVAALAGGGVLYYLGRRKTSEAAAVGGTVALLPSASATDLGAALRVTF